MSRSKCVNGCVMQKKRIIFMIILRLGYFAHYNRFKLGDTNGDDFPIRHALHNEAIHFLEVAFDLLHLKMYMFHLHICYCRTANLNQAENATV